MIRCKQYLLQNTSRKEGDDGYNCDDSHITDDVLNLVCDAPQPNRHHADEGYPPLEKRKRENTVRNISTQAPQDHWRPTCLAVNGPFTPLICLISISPSPSGDCAGRYDTSNMSQMSTIEMAETGIATANQEAQSRGGSMACRAMRFCGEDMGEDWPPMFAARAMASCKIESVFRRKEGEERERGKLTMRQGPKGDLGGRVRRMGYSHFRLGEKEEEKQDTYTNQSEAEGRSSNIAFRKKTD